MANNLIYRFAENATGTNILSDTAFKNDTDRPIGHQPGIARQELENKALRSYSAIAVAVAQFMADNQGTDVTDSLTTAQLNSIFNAAITAAAASGPGRSLTGVTFASGVTDAKIVRFDSANNQYVAAIADGTGNDNAVGVADVTNNAVYIYGRAPLFSGLSAGQPYYLSPTQAGNLTSARPSSDAVAIGIATSSTDLMVGISHLGVSPAYLQTQGFELVAGSADKPSKGVIIGGVAMRKAYNIPSGFTGSEARALTAFTAASSFTVNAYPAGSTTATAIGTVNFAAGATAGTFTSASGAYTGAAGDMLTVEAPATQDSTGAQIAITIHGTYA